MLSVSTAKKRAKAPVKVHFLGWDAQYDEFVGEKRIRSKALKEAALPKETGTKKAREVGQIVITYWAGRGRCEPLRYIIAAGGATFKSVHLNHTEKDGKEQLARLREEGKLAYDQLPLVEVDGLNLVQTVPTAIYLAQKFRLYPKSSKDQWIVGHIVAACQDAREKMVGFPFGDRDRDKMMETLKGKSALIGRFAPKWNAMLEKSGGPFFLGKKPTMADTSVTEVLDFFTDIFGAAKFAEVFEPFVLLRAMQEKTHGLGVLKDWIDVGQKQYSAWDEDSKTFSNWSAYVKEVVDTFS